MKDASSTPVQVENHVVSSPAMTPPPVHRMFESRPYTTRADAPATHARLVGDPASGEYALVFNGVRLVNLSVPVRVKPTLRFHSDGDFQSAPMIQQFIVGAAEACDATITFRAPVEIVCMRPERAARGQAILGQVGRPLLRGVNGVYLPDWDVLVSFHGYPFEWLSPRVNEGADGFEAALTLRLSRKPLVVLLRPRYYGEHLGYAHHKPWLRRPDPRPIAGWCSWEAYHDDVTQGDVERAAETLKPLRPYGLEYMQLDDGYQQARVPLRAGGTVCESWLETNERFPGGHEAIVDAMRGGGFVPGIWTNATLTDKENAEAAGCCLKKADGELIRGDWIQYVIDCLPATLDTHVKPYYRAFHDLGYRYVKSDSIRHLIYDGLQEAVRLGVLEPEDARARFRAYLEAARQSLGDDVYYLSCWGVLTQAIGLCDAMRVATDANPSFAAYSMQLRETARWFFAQRVLFTLDPDHVCVRGDLRWVRMMLSLVSLTGGLYMISDKPEAYDETRLELVRRTLPALATRAAETGPVDYSTPACAYGGRDLPPEENSLLISHEEDAKTPFASLFCTHFDQGGRQWAVLERAAVIPLEAVELSLDALALDPNRVYCAYDAWTGEAVIVRGGALRLPALELGDCTVLALTDVTDGKPRLVGSDRHVSADAVSVRGTNWDGEAFTLSLRGFAGLRVTYAVYAAPGARVAAENAQARALPEQDGVTRVEVTFESDEATVTLRA